MSPPPSEPADPDSERPRVRVRGIYATALTNYLLTAEPPFEVVQVSDPIDRRFDRSFSTDTPDVTVSTTRDRLGVEVTGDPDQVAAVRSSLDEVAIDTFSWRDVAAQGAVFRGSVVDTTGGGAIVTLAEDREGFLPFDDADGYVEVGDDLRVQVAEARAPWGRGRPVLTTELRVPGAVATLVADVDSLVADTPDGTASHELVRTTKLLSTAVPDDWGIVWEHGAADRSVAELDAALSAAVERAQALESELDAAGEEGQLAAPFRTVWVRFGRTARFALDDHREAVTPTMPGHHRTKAGDERASGAVDFAEHLGVEASSFPFDAVTASFGPAEGERVAIGHGKPDGRCVELGRGQVTEVDATDGRVTVQRAMSGGGTYDALDVPRVEGDVATTRFAEGRWWYPTVYRGEDGVRRGTYVNVCTPVEVFPDAVRYVDLHVDVIKYPDGEVEVVDEDDLAASVEAGTVSPALAEKATDVATRVADALRD